ncbi:MAG: hypothetical protein H6Q99_330 [Proteobacteria bacterium]|nr:hypothetical protein [Pseudomonadota bacterium]
MAAILWAAKHWRLVAAGMAALALLVAAWWLIDFGRGIERVGQDRGSLNNWRDRSAIDDAMQTDDDVALCMRLGGGGDCRGLRVGR